MDSVLLGIVFVLCVALTVLIGWVVGLRRTAHKTGRAVPSPLPAFSSKLLPRHPKRAASAKELDVIADRVLGQTHFPSPDSPSLKPSVLYMTDVLANGVESLVDEAYVAMAKSISSNNASGYVKARHEFTDRIIIFVVEAVTGERPRKEAPTLNARRAATPDAGPAANGATDTAGVARNSPPPRGGSVKAGPRRPTKEVSR